MSPGSKPTTRRKGASAKTLLTIRLIHWNELEARARMTSLRRLGHKVLWTAVVNQSALPGLKSPRPDIILIDLGRLPSQGRDVALWLRKTKSTREIPLAFLGGEEAKVAKVRKSLPDATFSPWSRVRSAMRAALTPPAKAPAVPASTLAGYSGTPLPRKLGIKPEMVVALSGAPAEFEKRLAPLPPGARIMRRTSGRPGLILWFVRSKAVLTREILRMGSLMADGGGLWIAWPKQASGVRTDVTQNDVRRTGLASGLVDYKICAIDGTWSGLKFARRKRP